SVFLFFFSSRRRHTRFSRDWSSDVCSSDLPLFDRHKGGFHPPSHIAVLRLPANARCTKAWISPTMPVLPYGLQPMALSPLQVKRSEERRVGKECRCRWSPSQYQKEGAAEVR